MHEDDLLHRLRGEARFRAVPLLDADARITGLHLHRFLPGQVLDVVQVWNEVSGFHAVRAQLENSFDPTVPFAPPAALARDSGTFAEVADRLLLPFGQRLPNVPAWPRSDAGGT